MKVWMGANSPPARSSWVGGFQSLRVLSVPSAPFEVQMPDFSTRSCHADGYAGLFLANT